MNMFSSESARHLMHIEAVYSSLEKDVEAVLQRMIHTHVKALTVLDAARRVVADLTLFDLLSYCRLTKSWER